MMSNLRHLTRNIGIPRLIIFAFIAGLLILAAVTGLPSERPAFRFPGANRYERYLGAILGSCYSRRSGYELWPTAGSYLRSIRFGYSGGA